MDLKFEAVKPDPIFTCKHFYRCCGFLTMEDLGGAEEIKWLHEYFEARDDDIYVASFPKTGTTWAQEMTYVIANDLNFEKAKSSDIEHRFPFIDYKGTITGGLLNSPEQPRFLKTHLPYSLLPSSIINKKCKIIYVIRNPKDTCVSLYYFLKLKHSISSQCELKYLFDLFMEDQIPYTPFWKHVLEFLEHRHDENIFIINFEDMKRDIKESIKQVASFLGKNINQTQIDQVAEHCDFKNMKANPAINYQSKYPKGETEFMRKGEVGDWKNHFTDEMNNKMDMYVEKYFKGTGLQFQYEL